jgi:HEPN domain-containing protein
MSPQVKKYKKSYAFELLRIALGDLESAMALKASESGRPENVVYHAQQCIEKVIKSVLVFNELPVVHTHDLESLILTLPEGLLPPDSFLLGSLSQYAMVRRYEEGTEELSSEDLQNCINIAKSVLDWGNVIVYAK